MGALRDRFTPAWLGAAAFIGVSAVYLCHLMAYHLWLIGTPWQLEFREGALLVQVHALREGLGYYEPATMAANFNCYGIGYNWIAAKIAGVFGTNFMTLRAVSAIALLAATVAMVVVSARQARSVMLALAVACCMYMQVLYDTVPLARPDALGFLLFTAGILIVQFLPFSFVSAVLVFACAYVGFLVKPYFIVLAPLAFSYWIFSRSWRRALPVAAVFGGLSVLSLFVINHFKPGYLTSSVFTHMGLELPHSSESWAHMSDQLRKKFMKVNGGVLVVIIAMGAIVLGRWRRGLDAGGGIRVLSSFALYATVMMLLLFVFRLGHHQGAYLTYLIQLVLPPLLVLLVIVWREVAPRARGFGATAACLIVLFPVISNEHRLLWSEEARDSWEASMAGVSEALAQYGDVYASPLFVGHLFARGSPVLNSGQTEFLGDAARAGNPLGLGIPAEQVRQLAAGHQRLIDEGVAHREFDALMLVDADPLTMRIDSPGSGYRRKETFRIGVWSATLWDRSQ